MRDAQVFALVPPAVPGTRQSSGFDIELEDRGDLGHAALIAARNKLLGMAAQRSHARRRCAPTAWTIRRNFMSTSTRPRPTRWASHRRHQRHTSAAWGGTFVNNFVDRGRVKRVYMQGDAPYRMTPEDLDRWYVRNATGTMAPFSSFATAQLDVGPAALTRYNGLPAIEIQGSRRRAQLRHRAEGDGQAVRADAQGHRL